jgi:hypothetical protein
MSTRGTVEAIVLGLLILVAGYMSYVDRSTAKFGGLVSWMEKARTTEDPRAFNTSLAEMRFILKYSTTTEGQAIHYLLERQSERVARWNNSRTVVSEERIKAELEEMQDLLKKQVKLDYWLYFDPNLGEKILIWGGAAMSICAVLLWVFGVKPSNPLDWPTVHRWLRRRRFFEPFTRRQKIRPIK